MKKIIFTAEDFSVHDIQSRLTSDIAATKANAKVAEINKLIEGALEVTGYKTEGGWLMGNDPEESSELDTHRAWLIGVEPIKEKSLDDIFQDAVKGFEGATLRMIEPAINRLKAELEKSGLLKEQDD